MKFLVLSVLFTCILTVSYGQDQDKLFYVQKVEKYRRMKNSGAVLTVGGGILTIVGIVVGANSSVTTTTYGGGGTYTEKSGNPELAVASLLIGTGGLGAGIPLWIVGSRSEQKYKRKLEGLSIKINGQQKSAGLTLVYKF